GGIAIISRDCLYYEYILDDLKNKNVKNICTFGESEEANSRLICYSLGKDTSLSYVVNSNRVDLIIPSLLPKHQAVNFAACLAVASSLKLDLDSASKPLKFFDPGNGRGKIIQVQKNSNKFEIICDYYNANPASVRAALQYLKIIEHRKKVIILGDMLELGVDSLKLHLDLYPALIGIMATKILLVGTHVKIIADLLPKSCYVRSFINVEELMVELFDILKDGELILIKGSRSIGLDRIMQYFDQVIEG
ncbi:MAG: glutamate ligase domain-containing protein, partial [Janthinobacterium lividum]